MKRKLYWTSDWHVGHKNCLDFDQRPFKDLDEMHHALIKNFNFLVPKHGITYFLGDMGLCSYGLLKEIVDQLNGTKVLIRGNHDGKMDSMYNAGFDVVLEKAQITLGPEIITMSHCPLYGVFREDTTGMARSDGTDKWHGEKKHRNKYSFPDFGQFHLSGHIHSRKGNNKSIRQLGRQFDVGVPANNFKPVSISDIMSWISRIKPLINNWRDVVDFPEYKVNGIGEIRSFKRYKEGRVLSPYKDKDGYMCVTMMSNERSKAEKVHRVVAKAFLNNPENLPQVNHINGHKFDCSIPNLEWSTNIKNQQHAWDNDLKTIKLTTDNVREIKGMIKNGVNNSEIARIFNVDPSTISNIRTGKIWTRIKQREENEKN